LYKIDNNNNCISENILKLNKNKIKLLLKSIFDCSSIINNNDKYIKLQIFSNNIILQIKYLLKLFKIECYVYLNTLYIYDDLSIYHFYNKISYSYENTILKLKHIVNININIVNKNR
jgi:hypothetical protein